MSDPINPPHYKTEGGIECIDAIEAALGPSAFIDFCRGNVIKYAWRTGKKDSIPQELRKASWYALRAAEAAERMAK